MKISEVEVMALGAAVVLASPFPIENKSTVTVKQSNVQETASAHIEETGHDDLPSAEGITDAPKIQESVADSKNDVVEKVMAALETKEKGTTIIVPKDKKTRAPFDIRSAGRGHYDIRAPKDVVGHGDFSTRSADVAGRGHYDIRSPNVTDRGHYDIQDIANRGHFDIRSPDVAGRGHYDIRSPDVAGRGHYDIRSPDVAGRGHYDIRSAGRGHYDIRSADVAGRGHYDIRSADVAGRGHYDI